MNNQPPSPNDASGYLQHLKEAVEEDSRQITQLSQRRDENRRKIAELEAKEAGIMQMDKYETVDKLMEEAGFLAWDNLEKEIKRGVGEIILTNEELATAHAWSQLDINFNAEITSLMNSVKTKKQEINYITQAIMLNESKIDNLEKTLWRRHLHAPEGSEAAMNIPDVNPYKKKYDTPRQSHKETFPEMESAAQRVRREVEKQRKANGQFRLTR